MMRRMKGIVALLVALAASLSAKSVYACSVFYVTSPGELVSNAELIVHAVATDYAGPGPGNMRTTGVTSTKVRFRIESVIKGSYEGRELELNGYLAERDDWNDKEPPYTFVRPEGRHGSCFANTYRKDGQFVLFLTRVSVPRNQGDTPYTVNWAALAPVNEQVQSANDPWLRWVKDQVEELRTKDAFSVVLSIYAGEAAPKDPVQLAEIRKKMDAIDYWNLTKYPPLFGGLDGGCIGAENIQITASRGTTTKNLRWLDSTCPKAKDSKAAQELLELVDMIKKAAPPTFRLPQ